MHDGSRSHVVTPYPEDGFILTQRLTCRDRYCHLWGIAQIAELSPYRIGHNVTAVVDFTHYGWVCEGSLQRR